jgi:DNA gyrase subunit B
VRVPDLVAVVRAVQKIGRRGVDDVTRFKGLGEMNADELCDTTMAAEHRRLLRVRLEDAVAADRMFTVLMGEQVEPRRRFIETHALDVAGLDV